jgi:proline iminopeptidase
MDVPVPGATLSVEVVGDGPPLVLMHGGPGGDSTTMAPFRALADEYTLVFYDHRGNGRSECDDIASMTWDNLTADAEAVRSRLGFERWAVLGHSFGGMVAMEYALRYPEALDHLVLVDTGGDIRWVQERAPQELAQRGYGTSTVELARRFYSGRIEPREMSLAFLRFGRAFYHHMSYLGMVREMLGARHMKARPEALIQGFGTLLPGWSVMDRLGGITTPTLVLAGRSDFQYPPEHQQELAAAIPGAQLRLIDEAGHNAPHERTGAVLAAVRTFLAGAASTGGAGGPLAAGEGRAAETDRRPGGGPDRR